MELHTDVYIYVQIDAHTVMCDFTGVLCSYTLICTYVQMDTHTVMCGFTGVLCSYILICANLNEDTCFVVRCCADVPGLVVTR
jgi:hypothetical protein